MNAAKSLMRDDVATKKKEINKEMEDDVILVDLVHKFVKNYEQAKATCQSGAAGCATEALNAQCPLYVYTYTHTIYDLVTTQLNLRFAG